MKILELIWLKEAGKSILEFRKGRRKGFSETWEPVPSAYPIFLILHLRLLVKYKFETFFTHSWIFKSMQGRKMGTNSLSLLQYF